MFKNLNKIFYMNRRFNRNVTVWGNIHNNYKSNNIQIKPEVKVIITSFKYTILVLLT